MLTRATQLNKQLLTRLEMISSRGEQKTAIRAARGSGNTSKKATSGAKAKGLWLEQEILKTSKAAKRVAKPI